MINLIEREYDRKHPDAQGKYGRFGGRFVPEVLAPALEELESAFKASREDIEFQGTLSQYLRDYAGRPTPLYYAVNFSEDVGFKVYLKREDLVHGGAHKLNNTLGQALLAKRMGKTRLIAETGAGQHGLAAATAAAMLGLKCEIYMGAEDMERQKHNVYRMNLLGAEVHAVHTGSRTLKDAINEAMRDWITNIHDTHYVIGSVVGPHPYPLIVREFQTVIGREIKQQIHEKEGKLPNILAACIGGGSNAIGAFHDFIEDVQVELHGVEAGGLGLETGQHAASLSRGKPGVLHGSYSFLLQTEEGQVRVSHSVSAGLDYPGVGPEHAHLKDIGRLKVFTATDKEALHSFHYLSRREGIIPALEPSHAIAHVLNLKGKLQSDAIVIVNLSGRGDKDIGIVEKAGFRF